MCQRKDEGGRCYYHQRQRVDTLEQRLAESSPDTTEREEISSSLETARADLVQTRTGLQEHITECTAAGGSYDAEQLTANINRYVADSPTGKPLTLPGGSFRVVRAHTSHGHTVLEVPGPTSARSYSSGLAERYTQDAAGKQVTRATPTELQRDFHTMLVLADGRAGAAIRHSGEISAVYSDGSSRGATRALLPIAAERGGTHLECFDALTSPTTRPSPESPYPQSSSREPGPIHDRLVCQFDQIGNDLVALAVSGLFFLVGGFWALVLEPFRHRVEDRENARARSRGRE